MAFDAHEVALWILSEAKNHDILISHMKLQKLLYYAQASFIAMTGEPLFHNSIFAWQHGPVVPDVYRSFSKFGSSAIHDVEDVAPPERFKPFIDNLLKDKGRLSAHELRNLSHNEDTWYQAWANPVSHEITISSIDSCCSPSFWASDEEDDFQPTFSSAADEDKFFRDNIKDDEINAILASR